MNILSEIIKVVELQAETLNELGKSIGSEFESAVRLIHGCLGKVILTGIGKSGLIAQKIASTMVSTGTPAIFLHPADSA